MWKGDYEAMKNYLGSINWSEILSGNVHDDWQMFKTTVQNTMARLLFLKVIKLLLFYKYIFFFIEALQHYNQCVLMVYQELVLVPSV